MWCLRLAMFNWFDMVKRNGTSGQHNGLTDLPLTAEGEEQARRL